MKIGDYVRTIYDISKITDIEYNERVGNLVLTEDYNYIWYKEREIIKSSPNIIDLIEVGDYVNGREVREVYDLGFGKCFCFKNEYGRHYDKTYKIKTIVTKEQFKEMEYEVK